MSIAEVEAMARVEEGPQLEAQVAANTNLKIDMCYYASD